MKTFTIASLLFGSGHFFAQQQIDHSITEGLTHPSEVRYLELITSDSIEFIKEFTHLESLTLINFTDSIAPFEVGDLSSLKELRLINDNFKYLPDNYINLKQLERIELIKDFNLDLERVFTIASKWPLLTEMRLEGYTKSLDSIDLPSGLRLLSLRHNHLEAIPESVFALSELKVLDLGNNEISKINDLEKLPSLTTLYLDHQPKLKSSYSDAYFRQFKNLSTVYLPKDDSMLEKQNETMTELQKSISNEAISKNAMFMNYQPHLYLKYGDYSGGGNHPDDGKIILKLNTK
jgi:hypothetical protein